MLGRTPNPMLPRPSKSLRRIHDDPYGKVTSRLSPQGSRLNPSAQQPQMQPQQRIQPQARPPVGLPPPVQRQAQQGSMTRVSGAPRTAAEAGSRMGQFTGQGIVRSRSLGGPVLPPSRMRPTSAMMPSPLSGQVSGRASPTGGQDVVSFLQDSLASTLDAQEQRGPRVASGSGPVVEQTQGQEQGRGQSQGQGQGSPSGASEPTSRGLRAGQSSDRGPNGEPPNKDLDGDGVPDVWVDPEEAARGYNTNARSNSLAQGSNPDEYFKHNVSSNGDEGSLVANGVPESDAKLLASKGYSAGVAPDGVVRVYQTDREGNKLWGPNVEDFLGGNTVKGFKAEQYNDKSGEEQDSFEGYLEKLKGSFGDAPTIDQAVIDDRIRSMKADQAKASSDAMIAAMERASRAGMAPGQSAALNANIVHEGALSALDNETNMRMQAEIQNLESARDDAARAFQAALASMQAAQSEQEREAAQAFAQEMFQRQQAAQRSLIEYQNQLSNQITWKDIFGGALGLGGSALAAGIGGWAGRSDK